MYGVAHIARVWINRVRLPILRVVSSTGKMNTFLSALFAPENLALYYPTTIDFNSPTITITDT